MLKNDSKRIATSSDWAQILNDVKLLHQSEGPCPIRKDEPVLLDHLIVGVHGFLVFLVPLACGLLASGRIQIWQSSPQGLREQLRQVDASRACRSERFRIDFNGHTLAHC